MLFRLSYLQSTLAHFKGQGLGHAHFDCQYLLNGGKSGQIAIAIK